MNFRQFAPSVLVYNLAVILWGAYVRATGSGAGCGAHWPLCTGVVVPRSPRIETLIEFTHRLSSGLALVLAVVMVIWAWRSYQKGSYIRKSAFWVLAFTLMEALVGAGLVLFGLTADNDSTARAVSIAIHQGNTFLLLGALAVCAWWATHGEPERITWRRGSFLVIAALLGAMLIGASGAITALGDTLFPAGSLVEGLSQDASPSAHFLIRLRVYHPLIAVAVSGSIYFLTRWLKRSLQSPKVDRLANRLLILIAAQLFAGALNIALLAPVWMQMIHLLLADLVWISLILLAESFFTRHAPVDSFAHEPVKNVVEKIPAQ